MWGIIDSARQLGAQLGQQTKATVPGLQDVDFPLHGGWMGSKECPRNRNFTRELTEGAWSLKGRLESAAASHLSYSVC